MVNGKGRKLNLSRHRKIKSSRPLLPLFALLIVGTGIGIALAVAVTPLLHDVCLAAIVCQRQLSLLIGVIALALALNISVMVLLYERLNRLNEERILEALLLSESTIMSPNLEHSELD